MPVRAGLNECYSPHDEDWIPSGMENNQSNVSWDSELYTDICVLILRGSTLALAEVISPMMTVDNLNTARADPSRADVHRCDSS